MSAGAYCDYLGVYHWCSLSIDGNKETEKNDVSCIAEMWASASRLDVTMHEK